MFVTQRMAVCTISDQNVKERSRKCEFKPFNFKTELSFSPHSLNWQHCAIEREYMNWSRSCDSFDQEFVSPNEDKRKCISQCEENIWTDQGLVKVLIKNLFLPVKITGSVWANVRRICFWDSTKGQNESAEFQIHRSILPIKCDFKTQQKQDLCSKGLEVRLAYRMMIGFSSPMHGVFSVKLTWSSDLDRNFPTTLCLMRLLHTIFTWSMCTHSSLRCVPSFPWSQMR